MFLGIDGGGTKTSFVIINDAGGVIAMHEEGSAYYLEVGLDGVKAMLNKGIQETLSTAGITNSEIHYAFIGLPAYGEDSKLKPILDKLPSTLLMHERYQCGNDMICSWAGSLACKDGISLIAGTGSMAYGEFEGRKARAGGWGELFSDEGSAYWIAREGLQLFSKMSDGRAERGELYTLLRQHFSLNDDLDLCAAIYDGTNNERSHLAKLAKLVANAAIEGDGQALAIFDIAAFELTSIIHAVRKNLLVPKDVILPVSYSGGVFRSHHLIIEPFRNALAALEAKYELSTPIFSPVIGAAIYAAKCSGVNLSIDALNKMSSTIKHLSHSELVE